MPTLRRSCSSWFMFSFVFLLFASVAASSVLAQAPASPPAVTTKQSTESNAGIEGVVCDPESRPVPQARVTLLFGLSPLQEVLTDAAGRYRFEHLRTGAYFVMASAPGFSERPAEITIAAGGTQTLDLHLALSAVEERVAVSASLDGAVASQVGSSISIVSRQQIEERDAHSVFDVLRDVPGVAVSQAGRYGGVTSLFIRGGNSNYNLVMMDGVPINLFGGDFDFASIATDGVERVELSRGPESALFGANAVSGVVNIVSESGQGAPHLSFLAEGGSYDTRRLAAGGSGLFRGLSWAFNLSRLDSNGVVANDGYRNQSSHLNLGYSRSPRRQFTFHFFGNANSAGAPGAYGSDPDHLFPGIDTISRDNQNLFAYQADYSEQFTTRLKQVFSVSVSPDRSLFISSFSDSFLKNLRVVAHTHGEVTVSRKDVFVYGFEYTREQFQDTFITDANNTSFVLPRASYAYFAENRWNPGRRWFLTTGIRIDDLHTGSLPSDGFSRPFIPESSVAKINPRIATAFVVREAPGDRRFGATRLHGSFGTGMRPPNGFELAFTDNPRLKPERNISFDSGIEQRFFSDRAIFDVTYFYNRFKDQIVTLGGNLSNLSTFSSDNLANARAQGLEMSLRLRPTRSLDVSAEYTWLDTAILALDGSNQVLAPLQVGQPFLRRPRSSAGYNITWHYRRLMFNTNASIRGPVLDVEPNDGTFACVLGLPCLFRNPGYVLANAGFAYQLPRGIEIHGVVKNLANQKYEEVLGFPSLRLHFLAGVRYQFGAR